MTSPHCLASVRMISDISSINVRAGAGTHTQPVGVLPVGTNDLHVLDVQPDETGASVRGHVYQWFKLALPDGRAGWVREDLIEIRGECGLFGYGSLALPARPINMERDETKPETPDAAAELERVRKAAFNITAAFEGGSYATYQTYDAGIVSYGRFQATLASGALEELLSLYLSKGTGAPARQLNDLYMERVRRRDASLRHDTGFRALLIRLSRDPVMQAAQDHYATNAYWEVTQRSSIAPRGLVTPLALAFIFDAGVHHGNWGTERDLLRPAEQVLGAPIRSKVGENGITEQVLIARAATIRRDRLYAIANSRRLGGLKARGDFWVGLVNAGDWALRGDDDGYVTIRRGTRVKVRFE
jgi:hypothetical protein